MKKTRKILAAILAMIMVLSMSMTASAATIIVDDGLTEDSIYLAYKLLNAEYAETNSESEDPMISYTLNETYADALRKATGYTKGSDIVDYIGSLGSDEIREFADSVYLEIKDMDGDYITPTNEFTDIEQGYYLIVELDKGDDIYSLVMLDTAGEDAITVTTKEGVPELIKKVQEKNDTTGLVTDWQDGADYDIGDMVPFQLTGTVAEQYDSYLTYYYAFHDTLSEGLSFDSSSVVVKTGTGEDTEEYEVITTGYEVVTDELEEGCSFEVRFADLKQIESVTKDSKIVVEYCAELTENAVIGPNGNPNVAKLEYCNNPYYDGTGDEDSTSETPEDKVIVFTYELDINKVDISGDPLEGAGFTLYKLVADAENTEGTQTDNTQADDGQTVVAGEYTAVSEEITDVTTFIFKGLDAGQYKLVETTVPDGYSQADDVEFTVTADYDTEADDPKFITLTVDLVVTEAEDGDTSESTEEETQDIFTILDGVISADVVNMSNLLLPSTGGVGTTIFYIAGALIMIGAVVLFIRSRRMEEKK